LPGTPRAGQIVDEDERNLELPSHAAPRAERCLWLEVQLASVSHREIKDTQTTDFATSSTGGSAMTVKQSNSQSQAAWDYFGVKTSFNMMENLKTMAYTIYYGWPLYVTPRVCISPR
jgi:hypothetical protein